MACPPRPTSEIMGVFVPRHSKKTGMKVEMASVKFMRIRARSR